VPTIRETDEDDEDEKDSEVTLNTYQGKPWTKLLPLRRGAETMLKT
jgi:hypothetical protein